LIGNDVNRLEHFKFLPVSLDLSAFQQVRL